MLGLALEEPNDDCSVFEVKSLSIYMIAGLSDQLEQFGGVAIDFIDDGPQHCGFTVAPQTKPGGSDCSSGCPSSGCGDK